MNARPLALALILIMSSLSTGLMNTSMLTLDETTTQMETGNQTGCGYNSTLASISNVSTYPSNPVAGDNITFYVDLSCLMVGYINGLTWADSLSSMPNSYDNWYANSSSKTISFTWYNASSGNLSLYANLNYQPVANNSTSTSLDGVSWSFSVANSSTNAGCGYNPSYAYVSGWYNNGPYYVGDMFNGTIYTNCNLYDETMYLSYNVTTPSGNTIDYGSWNWTVDSTFMVKDIASGSSSSNLQDLTVVGNTVFFRASDGSHGSELWKSDGTASGTVMVKDIANGSSSSGLQDLTAVGNTLYSKPATEPTEPNCGRAMGRPAAQSWSRTSTV